MSPRSIRKQLRLAKIRSKGKINSQETSAQSDSCGNLFAHSDLRMGYQERKSLKIEGLGVLKTSIREAILEGRFIVKQRIWFCQYWQGQE